jgi:hypothetical protein
LLKYIKRFSLSSVLGLLHRIALVVMIFIIAYSMYMWVSTSDVWGLGGFFWSSWITMALVYLGVAVFLQMRHISLPECFVVSLTSLVSMIWLYEILYHFSFGNSWNYGNPPFLFLKENAIFINYALIAATAFAGYRYMKHSIWLWLTLLATVCIWIFWITIGFPQFEFPGKLYDFAWPRLVIANSDAWALPLNVVTKLLLGLVYILVYLPSRLEFSNAKKSIHRVLVERGVLDSDITP